jgi:lysophospholipase L1-like esterase
MDLQKSGFSIYHPNGAAPVTSLVICLGDSITRGQISASYVDILTERMSAEGFQFINAGVNNDLSYNILRRLDVDLDLQPQFVTVLVGTNDILALHTPYKGLGLRILKRLPQKANFGWYSSNLREIVRRIKIWTSAKIALLSIPVIGEDLSSPAIEMVRLYNTAVTQIAVQEQVAYLPLFEQQVEYLKTTRTKPEGRAYPHFMLMTAELVVARALFHVNFDAFSRHNGYHLVTDGVHFNHQGARLISRAIETWLHAATLEQTSPARLPQAASVQARNPADYA